MYYTSSSRAEGRHAAIKPSSTAAKSFTRVRRLPFSSAPYASRSAAGATTVPAPLLSTLPATMMEEQNKDDSAHGKHTASAESCALRTLRRMRRPSLMRSSSHGAMHAAAPPTVSMYKPSRPTSMKSAAQPELTPRRKILLSPSRPARSVSAHRPATEEGSTATQHPFQVLQHIGACAVNDAPLQSFLPMLALQVPEGHSDPADAMIGGAAIRSAPRYCAVHLVDREGHLFRARVSPRWSRSSPIEPLLRGYDGCAWDGAEFMLRPLVDLDETDRASQLAGGSGQHGGAVRWGSLFEHTSVGIDGTSPIPSSNIACWRRYATGAALYIALAQAGFCDAASLPFLAVQLVKWGDLLGGVETRVELLSKRSTVRERFRKMLKSPDEFVPVAITFPTAPKGVVQRLRSGQEEGPPSIVSQPFLDAEVFQLFYLQLVFRAYLDIRFPAMTCTWGANNNNGCLRSDSISASSSGGRGLAFEHPGTTRHAGAGDGWLLFPSSSSRILTFHGMEDAIIPLYASTEQLKLSAALPLFGTTPDVLCHTQFGYSVVEWASQQVINSPHAAMVALGELFTLFKSRYGCGRQAVWLSAVPPKVFRCGEENAFSNMKKHSGQFARFFVSTEARGRGQTSAHPAGSLVISRVPSDLHLSKPTATEDHHNHAIHVTVTEDHHSFADSFSVLPTHAQSRTISCLPSRRHSATSLVRRGSDVAAAADHVVASAVQIDVDTEMAEMGTGSVIICPTSPFTRQESLALRWRQYIQDGNIAIFDGITDGITLQGRIGQGGSGLVYRGTYGHFELPVAVKVFVIPDRMTMEDYVRESLTDVAFFVLCNQMDDFGICSTCRAHDFIVCATPPKGLTEEDAIAATRGGDRHTTKLCYLITDLMDGTLGRFLTEDDDDFDPCYDMLVNSPLRDAELFQFIFVQLVSKTMFDWKVLDIMLNGQLRGDNVGYRHIASAPGEALLEMRDSYQGIIVEYQLEPEGEVRYLRFNNDAALSNSSIGPMRVICFIDVGQGVQPNVQELTAQHFIGETVVESCVQDDGFGRYWPMEELYCRYVDTTGPLSADVMSWGSQQRIRTQEDAYKALSELLDMYYPVYGVEDPSQETLRSYLVYRWSPSVAAEVRRGYVYRQED